MNLLAKAKRSGTHKETPVVRARMEPLSVHFLMKNPLSIQIEMSDLQLVARMTDSVSQRLCTNEDAIAIGTPTNKKKTWTFSSSELEYEALDFCRLSSVGAQSGAWKSSIEEEPFFIGTKTGSTLEPGSTTEISLGICPLVLGDFEIVGVRYKLFNDVWVYHPFNVKGPLLQNSSYNRANRGTLRLWSLVLFSKGLVSLIYC